MSKPGVVSWEGEEVNVADLPPGPGIIETQKNPDKSDKKSEEISVKKRPTNDN